MSISNDRNFLQNPFEKNLQETFFSDIQFPTLLEISGEDAEAFLQGQLTNDVRQLKDLAQYAGLCSPKGRLLAIFLSFYHQEHYHLYISSNELSLFLLKHLKMYVLRSKVMIKDVSETVACFGLVGQELPFIFQENIQSFPQNIGDVITNEFYTLVRLWGAVPRYLFFTGEQNKALWIERLQKNIPQKIQKNWDYYELLCGVPKIFSMTQGQFIPQTLNLDVLNGISFNKGCYVGQEIVARTHYLGKVKRRMQIAYLEGLTAFPQAGDKLYQDKKGTRQEVGQVIQSSFSSQQTCFMQVELRLDDFDERETQPIFWNDHALLWGD